MLTDQPGVVSCQLKPEKFSNCEAVLGPGGRVHCVRNNDLFQPCPGGVYVPDNFREDTKPCPYMFQCQPRNDLYFASIKSGTSLISYELIINHLDTLICDYENKLICLPENNNDSLITADNIIQSFQRPEFQCLPNPCQKGNWPLLDDSGYFRCKSSEENILVPFSFLLTGANSLKCRRRQVYVYGRCRPRFFG